MAPKNPPAKDEPLDKRMIIPVSDSLLAEISNFWHDAQLPSRAEGVRALIRMGLEAHKSSSKRRG